MHPTSIRKGIYSCFCRNPRRNWLDLQISKICSMTTSRHFIVPGSQKQKLVVKLTFSSSLKNAFGILKRLITIYPLDSDIHFYTQIAKHKVQSHH